MDDLIQRSKGKILQLAEQRGVCHVRLFGSMVRDEARAGSDVDLLVELEPGRSGLALGGFLMDVSELLGRKVDVVTEKALHPGIRDSVLREAQPL
ncbi:MAG: nucleotidyltransferase family protein [Mariprofundaceae bacterium]|nr:nucleotidyltransferase family protein [Mariprofundaceae bacterium]